MRLLIDDEWVDHINCTITRNLKAIGQANISIYDDTGSILENKYKDKLYRNVDIRDNTFSPLADYKEFTVKNEGNYILEYGKVEPVVFTETTINAYLYSLSLRAADEYLIIRDCWENFEFDDDYTEPSNWTVYTTGDSKITISPRYLDHKKAVIIDDEDNTDFTYIKDTFSNQTAESSIFVVIAAGQTDKDIGFFQEDNTIWWLQMAATGTWKYRDGAVITDSTITYSIDIFYIIKITIHHPDSEYSAWYYDEANATWRQICNHASFLNARVNTNDFWIQTPQATTGAIFSIAAVDYSWAAGYTTDRILTTTASFQKSHLESDERVFQLDNKIMYCWDNFTADSDFGNPATNWVTSEPANTNVWVLPRFGGYKKAVELYSAGVNDCYITHTPISGQTSGTCYFLIRCAQTTSEIQIRFMESSNIRFHFDFNSDATMGIASTANYVANTWYFIKITFDCATDKVSSWYWDVDESVWTQIDDEEGMVESTEIDEIRIFTTTLGTWYLAAVDTSWASGYSEDRILFLTNADIAFLDYFDKYKINTYRLYYSDQLRKVPRYFIDIPYTPMTTSGTDPITITTMEGSFEIDGSDVQFWGRTVKDKQDVTWNLRADDYSMNNFPAFAAPTRSNVTVGPIYTEVWVYNSQYEYNVFKQYTNGLRKTIWCNDVAHQVSYWHTHTVVPFCDSGSYDDPWSDHTYEFSVSDGSVGKGRLFHDDSNNKVEIWFQIWDVNELTNCDDILFRNNNAGFVRRVQTQWGSTALMTAEEEFTVYDGIMTATEDATSLTEKKAFVANYYDAYINGTLVIGALGSKQTDDPLNYRLFIGELVDPSYDKNEHVINLIARDYLNVLKRVKDNFNTIFNHKFDRITTGGVAASVLTCEGDWDENSIYGPPTLWETDRPWVTNEFVDYGLVVIDRTRTTNNYIFTDSISPFDFYNVYSGSHIDTHTPTKEVVVHNNYGKWVGLIAEFTSPVVKLSVTEINLTYSVGLYDSVRFWAIILGYEWLTGVKPPYSYFKIEIWNYDTSAWVLWKELPSIVGHYSDTISITTNASQYVETGTKNIKIRVYARKQGHFLFADGIVLCGFFQVQINKTPFTASQYPITSNTATTITSNGANFITDGVEDHDGVYVCPKNEDIIKSMASRAPHLLVDEVDDMTYYSAIQMTGLNPFTILLTIQNKEEGSQFWQDLSRQLNFKKTFNSLGLTLGTDIHPKLHQFKVTYSPKELVNRVMVKGRDLGDGTILESDWYEDQDSMIAYTLHQDIISSEIIRNKAEANAYAEKYVTDHKDLDPAFRCQISGKDVNWIKQDILGKTLNVSLGPFSATNQLIEGVTWREDINGELIGSLRIGKQPTNMAAWEEFAYKLDQIDREAQETKSARMSNE